MFKNREFRVKMVKTPKKAEDVGTEEETANEHVDPEQIVEIAKGFVTHAAVVISAAVIATKVMTAASEIAVKRTPSKDRE